MTVIYNMITPSPKKTTDKLIVELDQVLDNTLLMSFINVSENYHEPIPLSIPLAKLMDIALNLYGELLIMNKIKWN
jgi:hypothetical protein